MLTRKRVKWGVIAVVTAVLAYGFFFKEKPPEFMVAPVARATVVDNLAAPLAEGEDGVGIG